MTKPIGVVALLLTLATACTPDGQPPSTAVAATAEPFDLSVLNGKVIRIEGLSSGDFSVDPPQERIDLRVVGKTIIWGRLVKSQCVLGGEPYGERLAVLYTPGQPRSGTRVPCEAQRRMVLSSFTATAPADVQYSSTADLQGNVLDLSGELTEHNSRVVERGPGDSGGYTLTEDIAQHQLLKVRISADKCQVLDFTWTIDVRTVRSFNPAPTQDNRRVRATGCSIVAAGS